MKYMVNYHLYICCHKPQRACLPACRSKGIMSGIKEDADDFFQLSPALAGGTRSGHISPAACRALP
jgi:hypothetical protein